MDDEPQNEDLIRYDILTQEALRGVIKRVLEEVMNCGLPGEHHFFITFDTNHPGVRLSKRMKERYPEDMTIVIQHTYWDLEVNEGSFKIDLSFDDIRERLKVPYDSVKGFFDPWVKFGLQFEAVHGEEEISPEHLPVKSSPRELSVVNPQKKPAKAAPKKKTRAKKKVKNAVEEDATSSGDQKPESADVVSLDSFRKKK
ncbi:MAG: ClpXP protease specificity-enhancing factor SspB [Rhizobiaceae bacterium]